LLSKDAELGEAHQEKTEISTLIAI
jgi:hypothetical protein